jgi:Uma2 family endonuclease
MIALRDSPSMTPQEYLAWEATQEERHEFFRGEVYARVGGSKAHNRIGINLLDQLDDHLDDGSCAVYFAGIKTEMANGRDYFYPDLVVTCDQRDQAEADSAAESIVRFPCLVTEVLSPSTEAFDRGGKFAQFRTLDSLQEYLLVQSKQAGVELFRRGKDGLWTLHPYGAEESFYLESIGLEVSVASLYRRVLFEDA